MSHGTPDRLSFRRLDESDLPLLHRWLNTPHVLEWWDRPGPTPDEVRAKYLPRVTGTDDVTPYVICRNAAPIGYIQLYRIGEGRWGLHDAASSVGVDLFIGDARYVGRGLGPRILEAFLRSIVFADEAVDTCYVDPSPRNHAAIRAYAKTGFRPVPAATAPDASPAVYLMQAGRADALRGAMVRRLVEQGAVRSRPIEEAFRAVPRHLFLPGVADDVVYSGEAVVTRRGPDGVPTSSSSMPAIMAIMLEQLQVHAGHRVLEIGTGTGFNAALLARLVGPAGAVTTVDIDDDIVRDARDHLDAAGYHAVRTITGDGWLGAPEQAPYDRIEATVGLWDLSPHWAAQLADGGILVVPVWLGPGAQFSVAFQNQGDRLRSAAVAPCGFMRLRGPHAGPEGYVCVDGWTVSLDRPDPGQASILAALLQTDPRVEPAPPVPAGWAERLAFEEPRAVYLSREDNWRTGWYGVLDAGRQSLAVLRGRELQTFGGDAARDILLGRLTGATPFDVRALTIDAIPSTLPPPSDAARWIRRPHFQFLVRESAAPPDRSLRTVRAALSRIVGRGRRRSGPP